MSTGGWIEFHGLTDWWLSELSQPERSKITSTFQPLGTSGDTITSGTILSNNQHVVSFLGNLAGWFKNTESREIAKKILAKGKNLASSGTPIDQHFLFQQMIEVYYKDRKEPTQLQAAISACEQQISIAPKVAKSFLLKHKNLPLPSHKGYEQLVIILGKSEKFQEALDLCSKAKSQGWSGDWDKRIEKLEKILSKSQIKDQSKSSQKTSTISKQ